LRGHVASKVEIKSKTNQDEMNQVPFVLHNNSQHSLKIIKDMVKVNFANSFKKITIWEAQSP